MRGTRGFTLVELMIALAIMALLSLLGYRALAALSDSEAELASEAQRWRTLDAFFARLEADVREAVPRAARTGSRTEPAWVGVQDAAGNGELRFSRAGPEFEPDPGSAGQRIAYRWNRGRVEILYWPHYDQPPSVEPTAYALVDDVAALRFSYLDSDNAWRDGWPLLAQSPIPRALRVELQLGDGSTIERVMVLQ